MESTTSKDITEKDGFRIVKIQNLERKKKSNEHNYKKLSQLDKIKRLAKNYNIKNENVYYYADTSTDREVTYEVNNFIGSFFKAYNNHHDVVLNPDNIWIMISLFLANYVDENSELLRKKFVNHEGKKKLVTVEYADSVQESLQMEKKWENFYEQIYKQIKSNTRDGVVEDLVCDFSTTGIIQKVFSTSIIMNSFRKYFDYGRCIAMCGINNVYFQGIRDDWVKLIKKTEKLIQYDVDTKLIQYVEHVSIILHKFLDTWDEKVDLNFWNTIMTTEEKRIGSGGDIQTNIEGWILHFFGVYDKVDLDDMPDFSIGVPVELENQCTGTKKNLEIIGNWLSVSKVDDYAYKSDLALAIIDEQKKEEEEYSEW